MKGHSSQRSILAVGVFLLGFSLSLSRGASPENGQFVGSTGCMSSSCHGGAGDKRSQYLTWVQQDFHSRAYPVLVSARSARMAETLGLTAAQTSPRCTVCHSPFQAVQAATPSRLTSKAQVDEGVSCESCHGAAGPWLRGHTRKDWSYATRVGAGMRDLRNFYVRANACVACHQNLDPKLVAAGHPELTFELDGQSVAEPRHWREDDRWNGPRAWLVGQAIALREMSWFLAKPEATNTEPADSKSVAAWNAVAWLLTKATADSSDLPVIESLSNTEQPVSFPKIQDQADRLARQAAATSWDAHRTTSMLQALMATTAEFASTRVAPEEQLERATRLVLALDRLSAPAGVVGTPPLTNPNLTSLVQDIRARPFPVEKFAADLATFRTTIKPNP